MKPTAPKVLFIVSQPFLQWRGSPIRVSFDILALSELGYQVDLLTLPLGLTPDLPPGVRLLRTPNLFRVKHMPIGPSFRKALFDIVLFFHAAWLVARWRPAILHGVEDAGFLAVILGLLSGRPVVFEKHSDPKSYSKGLLRNMVLWFYGKIEAFSLRHASAVIGTGPGLAAEAQAMAPRTPVHCISDIPSSLREADPACTARVRAELIRDPTDLLITYVGSFAVYQGVDLLLESIPLVLARHPRARFVIIGGRPQAIDQKRSRLKELGADQRVTFPGYVHPDQIPHYLGASDILVSPRLTGTNTPLKLLDYLKVGRAILACDTEANRQILDESTALLVPPEPTALAEGLGRLMEYPELRARLADAGRHKQQSQYTFPRFRERLKECYDRLPHRGAAGAAGLSLSCAVLLELEQWLPSFLP